MPTLARLVDIVSNNSETEAGMQEEREDDVARDEEVEGHRRFGPEDPPARQDNDSDEDEVEAHRWRYGAEEPGKRF